MVNRAPLTFQRSCRLYQGDVELAAGEQVRVSVILDGKTYAGSAQQFADYPSIVSPAAGEAFHQNVPSLVRWTLGDTSISIPGAGAESELGRGGGRREGEGPGGKQG